MAEIQFSYRYATHQEEREALAALSEEQVRERLAALLSGYEGEYELTGIFGRRRHFIAQIPESDVERFVDFLGAQGFVSGRVDGVEAQGFEAANVEELSEEEKRDHLRPLRLVFQDHVGQKDATMALFMGEVGKAITALGFPSALYSSKVAKVSEGFAVSANEGYEDDYYIEVTTDNNFDHPMRTQTVTESKIPVVINQMDPSGFA